MDPSMLAAAALQARNNIMNDKQKEEVIVESDKSGERKTSTQNAPQMKFTVPKSSSKPEKPSDWKKPERKYGGFTPATKAGGAGGPAAPRPDLTSICDAVVMRVQKRRERVQTEGYCMKVRDSCPLPCCQYLHSQEEEEQQQQVIIKKIIRRRRPKPKTAQEQAPATPGEVPSLVSCPPALVSGTPAPDQQQAAAAAAARKRQEEEEARRQHQQQQQAERKHQEELARQKQLEEQQRQQKAAEEGERRRQAAAVAEAERQEQAAAEAERQKQAAAAATAEPAAPVQKVATFQNLGTDPAMATAELYYESTRWGPLGHGDPAVTVGSFPGHRWFIVANGTYAKLFTVGEEAEQTFTL